MLTYIITGDNVSMDGALRAHIEKRFHALERFTGTKAVEELQVIASKTTAYEREDTYRVEARFSLHTRRFFAAAESHDIKKAIDEVRTELLQEVTRSNSRRRRLFHKGARAIKDFAKGIYARTQRKS